MKTNNSQMKPPPAGGIQPSSSAGAAQSGVSSPTAATQEPHAGASAAASQSLGKHPRSEEDVNAASSADSRQAPARQPRGKSLARLQATLVADPSNLPTDVVARIASFTGSISPYETAQSLAKLSEVSRRMRQAVQDPGLAGKSQRLAQLVQAARQRLPQQLTIGDVKEKKWLMGLLSPADRSRLVDVVLNRDQPDNLNSDTALSSLAGQAGQFEHLSDAQRTAIGDRMLSRPDHFWNELINVMGYLSPAARSDIVTYALSIPRRELRPQPVYPDRALHDVAQKLDFLSPQDRQHIFTIAMTDRDRDVRMAVMSGLLKSMEHLQPEQRSHLVQQMQQTIEPRHFHRWADLFRHIGHHLSANQLPQFSAVITEAMTTVMVARNKSRLIKDFADSAAVMTAEQRALLVDTMLALPFRLREDAIIGFAKNIQHFAVHERDRVLNAVLNDSGPLRPAHIALLGPSAAHFSPDQRQQLVTALMNDYAHPTGRRGRVDIPHRAMASLCAGSNSFNAEQQLAMVRVLTGRGVTHRHLVALSRGVAGLCPQAKGLLFQRFAQHPNLASKLDMVTAMAPHFSSLNDGERNLLMQVATGPIANLANRDAVSSQYHAIAALGHSINKM